MTLALGSTSANAKETYFVDFDQGADQAEGTTPSTAWKHAPGDANATARPRAVKLQPGDEVVFKGGIVYRGTISLTASGSSDAPIVYEGSGGWGSGQAVLSGLDAVAADFVADPARPKLSIATLPFPVDYSAIIKVDGVRMWLSSYPRNQDPYWIDKNTIELSDLSDMRADATSSTTWVLLNQELGNTLRKVGQGQH